MRVPKTLDKSFLVPEEPLPEARAEDDPAGDEQPDDDRSADGESRLDPGTYGAFDSPEVRPSVIPRLERHRFHSAILPMPYDRCVSVYLPEAYASEPDRRFSVFYLHDGQNLFDDRTAYVPGHTWQAHTTADRVVESGEVEPVILVGIANAGLRRMAEYTPTKDFRLAGGEGRSYGRMLIEELKPQIDAQYRTLTEASATGLGGSSLGGLISLFLGFEYPETFGKLAVMSPSIWWNNRSIFSFVEAPFARPDLRIWLDIGTGEGAKHVRDTDQLFRVLRRRGWHPDVDLAYQRIPDAFHSEDAWADRFDDVLRFLFPAQR